MTVHLPKIPAVALLAAWLAPLASVVADSAPSVPLVPARPGIYAEVELTTNLAVLSAKEREMLGLFIDAAAEMDGIFWQQTFPGDRASLEAATAGDPTVSRYVALNYGPWDRLAGDAPFVPGYGDKPKGANFYPIDMSKAEFDAADLPGKASEYTLLRRDAAGKLVTVPYSVQYREPLGRAAAALNRGAHSAGSGGSGGPMTCVSAPVVSSRSYRPPTVGHATAGSSSSSVA